MDELQIGIIGYGRFGRIHKEEFDNIPSVKVTCVCTGGEESAARAREELNIAVYSDWEAMLATEKLDVVDIASPNYLHAEQAIAAMNAGHDVILEKPIAVNIIEAKHLLRTQQATRRKVQVVFENRFDPFWRTFKGALERGVLTDPNFAKIESWRSPFREGSRSWRRDREKIGHELLEEAIHYFDLALWYFGKPDVVWGRSSSPSGWSRGKVSTAVVFLEYERRKLKVMILDSLDGGAGQYSMSMSGEKGAIFGAYGSGVPDAHSSWCCTRSQDGQIRFEPIEESVEGMPLRDLFQNYFENLRKGVDATISLREGYNALSLALTAVSAIDTGKELVPDLI